MRCIEWSLAIGQALTRIQMFSMIVLSVWPSLVISGCTPVPTFPSTNSTIIKTLQDFDAMKYPSTQFQDRTVEIAGRIIQAESNPRDTTFLAEWLPFPDLKFTGPESSSTGLVSRRFSLQFSGAMDHDGKRQGNEFLMVGKWMGMQDMITLQGLTKSIPTFTAECLHVWKTAGTDLSEFIWMDPLDESYPPPLEETYCVSSSD